MSLLALTAWPLVPNGHLTAPVWVAEAVRSPDRMHGPEAAHAPSPFYAELFRTTLPEIHFETSSADQLALLESTAEFFQIDSAWGASYRSQSLGELSFPIGPAGVRPRPGAVVGMGRRLRWGRIARCAASCSAPSPALPSRRPPAAGPTTAAAARDPGRTSSRVPRSTSSAPRPPPTATPPWPPRRRPRRQRWPTSRPTRPTRWPTLRNRLLLISTSRSSPPSLGCYGLVRLGLAPLAPAVRRGQPGVREGLPPARRPAAAARRVEADRPPHDRIPWRC